MNKQKLGKLFNSDLREDRSPTVSIIPYNGKLLKAWEVNYHIERLTGRKYSDSSTTARMREMKHIKCNLSDNTYKSTKTKNEKVKK